jgi:hypothetical protein
MFIWFLALERLAVSTIKKYISAVASLSKEMGFPIATAEFVQLATVFRGIKRQLGNKCRRKAPLRLAQLQRFKQKSIHDAQYLALCTIGLLGLFRLGELIQIQRRHVKVLQSHVEITLETSKTDPFRQGCVVYVFANGSTLDPVQATLFLLTEAHDHTSWSLDSKFQRPWGTKKTHRSLHSTADAGVGKFGPGGCVWSLIENWRCLPLK